MLIRRAESKIDIASQQPSREDCTTLSVRDSEPNSATSILDDTCSLDSTSVSSSPESKELAAAGLYKNPSRRRMRLLQGEALRRRSGPNMWQTFIANLFERQHRSRRASYRHVKHRGPAGSYRIRRPMFLYACGLSLSLLVLVIMIFAWTSSLRRIHGNHAAFRRLDNDRFPAATNIDISRVYTPAVTTTTEIYSVEMFAHRPPSPTAKQTTGLSADDTRKLFLGGSEEPEGDDNTSSNTTFTCPSPFHVADDGKVLGCWLPSMDDVQDDELQASGLSEMLGIAFEEENATSANASETPELSERLMDPAGLPCRQPESFSSALTGRSLLVVLHEASFTGAPLAAMELAVEASRCVNSEDEAAEETEEGSGAEGGGEKESSGEESSEGNSEKRRRRLLSIPGEDGSSDPAAMPRHSGHTVWQRRKILESDSGGEVSQVGGEESGRKGSSAEGSKEGGEESASKSEMEKTKRKVDVVLLNKKGGLLPELERRGLNVLPGKKESSWAAARKADVVVASSATVAPWIGES